MSAGRVSFQIASTYHKWLEATTADTNCGRRHAVGSLPIDSLAMISSGGAIRSIAQIENLHFGWRRYAGDRNVALRVRLAPCPAVLNSEHRYRPKR